MKVRLLAALACAALFLFPSASRAQNYPDRPVRIIIAFSPAGAIDVLGRLIADKLSTLWGQQVIVENRPGAGGNIGAAAAAQTAPDGYTLHFGAQTLSTNPTLAPSTAFDPVKSFEPIMLVATSLEIFMVANETPYKSLREVIDYAKANPGKLNYASVGIGSSAHLATVLFSDTVGIKMQHVPYSQMSQAYSDIFSGRTEIWFTTAGGSLPHLRSGKVRGLAVNGSARTKLLPDLPTMKEAGVAMTDEFELVRLLRAQGHAEGRSSTRSTAIFKLSSICRICVRRNSRLAIASSVGRPRSSRNSCRSRSPNGRIWRRPARCWQNRSAGSAYGRRA